MVASTFTLCNSHHRHRQSFSLFENLFENEGSAFPLPLLPGPWLLPVFFLTVNSTILGTSCKWNQALFVYTYSILKCIFMVNVIYVLKTERAFFFHPYAMQ